MTRTLLFLCLASAVAHADPKADAKAHIDKATAAHAAGRYDEAFTELSHAYDLDPDPELLYGMGQVQVKLGDCDTATTYFNRYLATKPDAKSTAITQKAIASCKSHPRPKLDVKSDIKVETTKPETTKPETTKPDTSKPDTKPDTKPDAAKPDEPKPDKLDEHAKADMEPPPPPPPSGRAWYADGVGDGLVAVGVAAGVLGAVMYKGALTSRDDADHATSYTAYQSALDDAHSKRTYAIIGGAAGGALVVAGIVHMIVSGGPAAEHVAVVPVAHGHVLTFSARF